MMKIVVVSDSHGRDQRLDEILRLESDADCYIHCGDIECSEDTYPMFHTVQGNNDLFYHYPDKIILPIQGYRILVMHGDQFAYMHRLVRMAAFARKADCDIFCYGHTHIASLDQIDHVMMVNPGSLWRSRDGRGPSYAIIQIDKEQVHADIKFLD